MRSGGCCARADVVTGAALTLDPAQSARFYRAVKTIPAVAGVALRDIALQNFRDTMAENMNICRSFSTSLFAGDHRVRRRLQLGARLAVRARAASWRACASSGSRAAEISLILLGELAILTVCALPVGAAIGYALGELIMDGLQQRGVPPVLCRLARRRSRGRFSSSSPRRVCPGSSSGVGSIASISWPC